MRRLAHMISPADLEATFVRSGLTGLTIRRRGPSWGNKWVVSATTGTWPKEKVLASEPNASLEAALLSILKVALKNPAPSAVAPSDLEDLL